MRIIECQAWRESRNRISVAFHGILSNGHSFNVTRLLLYGSVQREENEDACDLYKLHMTPNMINAFQEVRKNYTHEISTLIAAELWMCVFFESDYLELTGYSTLGIPVNTGIIVVQR